MFPSLRLQVSEIKVKIHMLGGKEKVEKKKGRKENKKKNKGQGLKERRKKEKTEQKEVAQGLIYSLN